MTEVIQVIAGLAVLANAVIYGTDVFSAVVQRPATAHLDDAVLTQMMGYVHSYADRRLPIPGAVGVITACLTAVMAGVSGRFVATVASGVAFLLLVTWLVIYVRVSAPINRRLTEAARAGLTPGDARDLQTRWDSVINLRVGLQTAALTALCTALVAA